VCLCDLGPTPFPCSEHVLSRVPPGLLGPRHGPRQVHGEPGTPLRHRVDLPH
jgi:hypothetical protein